MIEQDRRLIEILARTDAIWRPLRREDWIAPTHTVIWEARHRFAESGIPWTTGRGDEAGRKTQQRDVNRLAEQGLLTLCGDKRRAGVRLTEQAEIGLRSLCGLPNIGEAHAMLQRLIELSAKADDGQLLCREYWLAGLKNYSADCTGAIWEMSLTLAPALCRQWVESRSDIYGRCCYSATDVGRAAATRPAPMLPGNLPEWSEDAGRLYQDLTIAARAELRAAKAADPSEIGYFPLSCSLDLRKPRRKGTKNA